MRYSFHGHESSLELKDVVAFVPELAEQAAEAQEEGNLEEAVAFVLDMFGAKYVAEQRALLEVIVRRWAHLAPLARSTNDQERVRAIPERLAWRLDAVWPEGRAALHLMVRAVMHRTGCSMRYAPLCVELGDVTLLLDSLLDGLRAGFAASVDAQLAVDLLEQGAGAPEQGVVAPADRGEHAADLDWAAEITGP
ncbi:MAG: hypothetical protein IT382_08310 [Deltaproteobacteria bacterium]|nr:hypothetical protein [Deltaproteobacteria bacterium]